MWEPYGIVFHSLILYVPTSSWFLSFFLLSFFLCHSPHLHLSFSIFPGPDLAGLFYSYVLFFSALLSVSPFFSFPLTFSYLCSVSLSLPSGAISEYVNPYIPTYTPEEYWTYANTRLIARFMCGLMSDLAICKFKKKYCRTWHQMSLLRPGVIKQHKPNQTKPLSRSLSRSRSLSLSWLCILLHPFIHIIVHCEHRAGFLCRSSHQKPTIEWQLWSVLTIDKELSYKRA